jgi:hypothetical protein
LGGLRPLAQVATHVVPASRENGGVGHGRAADGHVEWSRAALSTAAGGVEGAGAPAEAEAALAGLGSCVRLPPECPDQVWTDDFVEDRTRNGRKFRML